MLAPEDLQVLGDKMFQVTEPLIEEILKDVARRIDKTNFLTESAKWQIERAKAIKGSREDIRKAISKYSVKTDRELKKIFEEAAELGLENDNKRFQKAFDKGLITKKPIDILATKQGQQVFTALFEKTKGEIKNFTSTLLTNNKYFVAQLDKTHNEIISGAFSYTTAIRKAVKEMSQTMTKVTYPSGHKDFIDVATWRAARTGASQTAGKLSMLNFNMMGGNLVKVTQHLGARPDHAVWQGETFWVNTPVKGFRSFYEVTGYGTGPGLKGWNCRHDFYPVFEGLDDLSRDKPLVSEKGYNNNEMYEAEKQAREYEREIRALKRERVMAREINDRSNSRALSLEIKGLGDKYDSHIKRYGLQFRNERLVA